MITSAKLKSISLNKSNILSIMNEILSIEIDDNVKFEIADIKDIREEDEYGGFKINVVGMLERLRMNMFIEFTTGDRITPKETIYQYNCIFEDRKIPIMVYTIQTIIAEKLETIISRSVANTRLKDFYDINVLMQNYKDEITDTMLILAIKNTFEKRETSLNVDSISNVISLLKDDRNMKYYWEKYQNKFQYAQSVDYSDVMDKLEYILSLLEKEALLV